jgi:hypothetical protein
MLYEILAGHLPFESDSGIAVALKHVNDPVKPPRDYRPDLPPAVEKVILTTLEKDPDRRYPTAEAMLAALTRAAAPALPLEAFDHSLVAVQPIGETTSESSSLRLKLAAAWIASRQQVDQSTKRFQAWASIESSSLRLKLAATWIALRQQVDQSAKRFQTWTSTHRNRFQAFRQDQWPRYRATLYARRRTIGAMIGTLVLVLMCVALTPLVFRAAVPAAPATATPADKSALAVAPVTVISTPASTVVVTPTAVAMPVITATRDVSPAPAGMVLVPAGSFTMGAVSGEFDADETPPHAVYLDDYYIDAVEVTNAQFTRFVNGSGYQTDAEKPAILPRGAHSTQRIGSASCDFCQLE